VAEHQQNYEFAAIDTKDILEDRQRSWEGFVQFATWGVAVTVVILLAMLLFIA
jgi:hypothetical protein